jgi:hypothetical protein
MMSAYPSIIQSGLKAAQNTLLSSAPLREKTEACSQIYNLIRAAALDKLEWADTNNYRLLTDRREVTSAIREAERCVDALERNKPVVQYLMVKEDPEDNRTASDLIEYLRWQIRRIRQCCEIFEE